MKNVSLSSGITVNNLLANKKCGENKTHLINLICEVMGGESIWVAEVFSENVELRIQK